MVFGYTLFFSRIGSNRRRTDGIRVEDFPEFTTLQILDEKQKTMISELKCESAHFKGRIIFMSRYNDIDWGQRGNRENCIANARRVIDYARRFTRGHWSFLGLGSEKTWYGTHVNKPDGEWDKTAGDIMLNFAESGHPKFRAATPKSIFMEHDVR